MLQLFYCVSVILSCIGADYDTRFRSVVTSYDYNAPLSEAGDPTDKLLAIRDVIKTVSIYCVVLHTFILLKVSDVQRT